MGGYDPERHRRRSVRLKTYDYSLPGPYFVTICVKDRACVLGTVDEDRVRLSTAGLVVARELQRITERSPNVAVDAAVVMPNHIHAIISLGMQPDAVGPRFIAPGTPTTATNGNATTSDHDISVANASTTNSAVAGSRETHSLDGSGLAGSGDVPDGEPEPGDRGAMNRGPTTRGKRPKPVRPAVGTLGEIVRGFKAASARVVRRDCEVWFAWQDSFYEHVIRNERELQVLWDYIDGNPARWAADEFYAT